MNAPDFRQSSRVGPPNAEQSRHSEHSCPLTEAHFPALASFAFSVAMNSSILASITGSGTEPSIR